MRPGTTEADPLAEPRPGRCTDCEGTGWRRVLPTYAEHMYPSPAADLLGAQLGEAAFAELVRQTDMKRAAAVNTVYPCRTCRPNQFYRWANGHYGAEHDADRCPQCVATRRGKEVPPEHDPPRPAARADTDG